MWAEEVEGCDGCIRALLRAVSVRADIDVRGVESKDGEEKEEERGNYRRQHMKTNDKLCHPWEMGVGEVTVWPDDLLA